MCRCSFKNLVRTFRMLQANCKCKWHCLLGNKFVSQTRHHKEGWREQLLLWESKPAVRGQCPSSGPHSNLHSASQFGLAVLKSIRNVGKTKGLWEKLLIFLLYVWKTRFALKPSAYRDNAACDFPFFFLCFILDSQYVFLNIFQ